MSRRSRRARQLPARAVPKAGRDTALGRTARAVGPDDALEATAPPRRLEVLGSVAVGIAAFVAYLVTLEPSVPTGDSGELIAAAWVLGVPHPPGYPLWTMLAAAFERLPFGSPAYGANLMSAVLDALAVSVVFLVTLRLTAGRVRGGRPGRLALVAAAIGALLLAFSTTFWRYSIVGEVFALNNLLAACLLGLMLDWSRRPERTRLLWVAALLSGLALTNQQTIALLAPGLLVLLVAGARRLHAADATRPIGLRPRDLGVAIGAFAVGLLPYLYLPLAASRDPAIDWGDPSTPTSFLAVLARSSYGTVNLALQDHPGSPTENLALLGGSLVASFVVVGIGLALVGLWWLVRRSPWEATALALAFLVAGPAFVVYSNVYFPDELTKGVVERFYILPAIPIAMLAGVGAFAVLDAAARMLPVGASRPLVPAVAGALLLVPLLSLTVHLSTVDASSDYVARDYGHDLLADLPPNALLLMRGDENYTSATYAQLVDHFRTDVVAMDVELLKLPSYVAQMKREHPAIAIPFASYDEGKTASLAQVAAANISTHPVYYVGEMVETTWTQGYDELRAGLVRELMPKGSAPDAYALLAADPTALAALHFPPRSYPPSTWESAISEDYASAAFDLAYALQSKKVPGGYTQAASMYRTAIRLAPDRAQAYKNLGVLLSDNGGDPKEIVAVWERFLVLEPNDPDADAIRAAISKLQPH
jgi:tetratricopeptide (TPR) repeat protein